MSNATPEQIRQKCERIPGWCKLPSEEQARIEQAMIEINESEDWHGHNQTVLALDHRRPGCHGPRIAAVIDSV